MVLGPGRLGGGFLGPLFRMGRRELITIAAAILTCSSALFGAMSYVEAHFVDKDELQGYILQLFDKLDSLEDRLQSMEEALRHP
jgi:hypothetical protein